LPLKKTNTLLKFPQKNPKNLKKKKKKTLPTTYPWILSDPLRGCGLGFFPDFFFLFYFLWAFLCFWRQKGEHCNSNGRLVGHINQIERLGSIEEGKSISLIFQLKHLFFHWSFIYETNESSRSNNLNLHPFSWEEEVPFQLELIGIIKSLAQV
jgi:hypothetical protein